MVEFAEAVANQETDKPPIDFEKLDAFGDALCDLRAEAIAGRKAAGIDDVWAEDEEYYEGMDEHSRDQEKYAWRTKPPGQTMPNVASTQSTVFPNITGPFVDAAAARISDMLLPTDEANFKVNPTPIPELTSIAKGEGVPKEAEQIARQAKIPEEQFKQQIKAAAERELEQAKERARKEQKRIEDWHIECQYHAQVRRVIEDSARLGCGVLKGPMPQSQRKPVYKRHWLDAIMELPGLKMFAAAMEYQPKSGFQYTEEIQPGSKWTDPWDFFPDPNCGDNIHNGSYVWERDRLTKNKVRQLKDQPGYLVEQLNKCIQEGPILAKADYSSERRSESQPDDLKKGKYEIWYFTGVAEREHLQVLGILDGISESQDVSIPVVVTLINNHVVKITQNVYDTGEYPYDVFAWRRRAGSWAGIGVARQVRVAQKIVSGGTRRLMDNAGVASAGMLVLKEGVITPADGKVGIAPHKIYLMGEEYEGKVGDAIDVITIPMLVNELMAIVEFGFRLAEQNTGLAMILQGQMSSNTPDTAAGQQLFQNNASTTLRRLAKNFDDQITEPHIRRYHQWILLYGEEDEKADTQIDALGSSALVERELQNQEIMSMGGLVTNPVFKKDPAKWFDEYLKSRHFDPKQFAYDDDKWQQLVEKLSQPPADPRVEVAKLQAQVKEKEWEAKAAEADKDREFDLILKGLDQELQNMKLTGEHQGKRGINLDTLKTRLTETIMKLRTQEKLAFGKAVGAPQVATPPTEPAGRAPRGQAYQK